MSTIRGENFNHQVWRALKKIPRGRVATYKEIARYLGKSGAARAVGNACNRNPDAPRVPCHRLVKSDGRLGGYAGGTKKKVALLKNEGVNIEKGRVENLEKIIYRFK